MNSALLSLRRASDAASFIASLREIAEISGLIRSTDLELDSALLTEHAFTVSQIIQHCSREEFQLSDDFSFALKNFIFHPAFPISIVLDSLMQCLSNESPGRVARNQLVANIIHFYFLGLHSENSKSLSDSGTSGRIYSLLQEAVHSSDPGRIINLLGSLSSRLCNAMQLGLPALLSEESVCHVIMLDSISFLTQSNADGKDLLISQLWSKLSMQGCNVNEAILSAIVSLLDRSSLKTTTISNQQNPQSPEILSFTTQQMLSDQSLIILSDCTCRYLWYSPNGENSFIDFLLRLSHYQESLPASIACHILPLLLCRELQFVGSPLETNIYSRFLCQGYEKSGSIELPSSCLDILDRAFNSRVLPEAASFLLIDAFARLDGPQSPVLPATENLLGKLARLWRDSEFSSHATVQHHRHISVSLLYALRRLCQSQTPFFESSAARSSAQDVPRSPAQLANWAAESEDDSDLKIGSSNLNPLSLSSAYQRLLSSGVVGDILEGVSMRLQSPLPAYRKLAMQMAEAFSILVDPAQPLCFDDESKIDESSVLASNGLPDISKAVASIGSGKKSETELERLELEAEARQNELLRKRQELLFAAEFAVSAVDNDPLLHSAPKYLPDIWTSLQPKGSDSVPDHSFDWILHPISTSESAGTSLAFVLQARFPMHRPVMMCNERPTGPVSGSPAASMSQSDPNISSTPPVVDDDDDLKPLHEVSQQSLADLNPQKPPLYLRDLWDHVRATDDVARQEAALRGAAALIRRRPADLVDISLGLLDSLLAWSDSFHLPQFAGRQMNAIVELSTASPTQCTSRLIHRIFGDGFSLADRALAIEAIGLTARNLCSCVVHLSHNQSAASSTSTIVSDRLASKTRRFGSSSSSSQIHLPPNQFRALFWPIFFSPIISALKSTTSPASSAEIRPATSNSAESNSKSISINELHIASRQRLRECTPAELSVDDMICMLSLAPLSCRPESEAKPPSRTTRMMNQVTNMPQPVRDATTLVSLLALLAELVDCAAVALVPVVEIARAVNMLIEIVHAVHRHSEVGVRRGAMLCLARCLNSADASAMVEILGESNILHLSKWVTHCAEDSNNEPDTHVRTLATACLSSIRLCLERATIIALNSMHSSDGSLELPPAASQMQLSMLHR